MKKIVAIILAGLLISPVLAGCTMPEESLRELPGVSTAPTETVTAAPETVPMAEATEAPTEAPAPFEVGQQVFAVYEHTGGTGIRMGFVVAFSGDDVILTTAIPGSGEAGELLSFPIANCYADSDDAWSAAGMEPLE